jgi:hypothetical protein
MWSIIVFFGINKQIRNLACSEKAVVDGERGGELFDLRDADGVKELQDISLAIVADEIVTRARATDLLYHGLAWMPCNQYRACVQPLVATLTSSPQRIVIEARLANRERPPSVPILAPFTPSLLSGNSLFSFNPCIRVDDIKVLIHPQLMRIFTHQHRPMLRRIRIFLDLVCDQFPQPGLLREPLARQPSHGVPTHLHWSRRLAGQRLGDGDDIFRCAEPNCVSEGYVAFLVTFLAA